jgi:phage-related protein
MDVEYWEGSNGRSPVKEVILELPIKLRKKIVDAIDRLEEFGFGLLGTSHFEKINPHNLYSLRVRFKNQRWRILSCFYNNSFVLLHIFLKRSPVIPIKEINVALRRKPE